MRIYLPDLCYPLKGLEGMAFPGGKGEPLAKAVDHRFDTGAVADAVPLLLEGGQIAFY